MLRRRIKDRVVVKKLQVRQRMGTIGRGGGLVRRESLEGDFGSFKDHETYNYAEDVFDLGEGFNANMFRDRKQEVDFQEGLTHTFRRRMGGRGIEKGKLKKEDPRRKFIRREMASLLDIKDLSFKTFLKDMKASQMRLGEFDVEEKMRKFMSGSNPTPRGSEFPFEEPPKVKSWWGRMTGFLKKKTVGIIWVDNEGIKKDIDNTKEQEQMMRDKKAQDEATKESDKFNALSSINKTNSNIPAPGGGQIALNSVGSNLNDFISVETSVMARGIGVV